jgi:hypothetical protein
MRFDSRLRLRAIGCLLLAAGLLRADLSTLKSEDFLAEIRRPFRQNAWGEITGRLVYVSKGKREKGNVRIRLTFSPDSLHAQVVINEKNVYAYEQKYAEDGAPETVLDLPDKEVPPGLSDYGVHAEDITFAFIYWQFMRELPKATFHQRPCRVFVLRHPDEGKGTVHVWFDAVHGFPLQAQWFRPDAAKPWRTLELKGAKKYDEDLWFVKEMRLEGADWKTQVRFDHVEINPVEKSAPVPGLPEAKEPPKPKAE